MRARLIVATGLGVGYAPLAPGTAGSLLGLALFALLHLIAGPPAALAGTLVVTAAGFWSAGAAERHFGRSDPGHVVIDEVAGQMLTLLVLPFVLLLLLIFLLFSPLLLLLFQTLKQVLYQLLGVLDVGSRIVVLGVKLDSVPIIADGRFQEVDGCRRI